MAFVVGSGSYQAVFTPSLNPASVAANSVQTEAFTVTGVRTNTMYHCDNPTFDAGLFVIGCYPSATNEITLVFFNPTGSAINPAAQTFRIIGF